MTSAGVLIVIVLVGAFVGVPIGQYATLAAIVAFVSGALLTIVGAKEAATRAFTGFFGCVLVAVVWPTVIGTAARALGAVAFKPIFAAGAVTCVLFAMLTGFVAFENRRRKLEHWGEPSHKASVKKRLDSHR